MTTESTTEVTDTESGSTLRARLEAEIAAKTAAYQANAELAAENTILKGGHSLVTAADLQIDIAYVAMFDEVDEGTAIFKVTNDPPTQGRFAIFDGLPSDFYLRLTGEGSKIIRGERKAEATIPIKP